MKTSFVNNNPLTIDDTAITASKSQFWPRIESLVITRLPITNSDELEALVDITRAARQLVDEIQRHHAPMKQQAHELHKTICTQESALVRPLSKAIEENQRLIGRWMHDQEQKRLANQRRIQAEEEKRFTKQIDKQAVKLEKAGNIDDAQDLREAAERNMPVVHLAPEAKPAGVRPPKPEWDFEIIDARAVPREWCSPDETRIKAYVKSVGLSADISGVRVFQKELKAQVIKGGQLV